MTRTPVMIMPITDAKLKNPYRPGPGRRDGRRAAPRREGKWGGVYLTQRCSVTRPAFYAQWSDAGHSGPGPALCSASTVPAGGLPVPGPVAARAAGGPP